MPIIVKCLLVVVAHPVNSGEYLCEAHKHSLQPWIRGTESALQFTSLDAARCAVEKGKPGWIAALAEAGKPLRFINADGPKYLQLGMSWSEYPADALAFDDEGAARAEILACGEDAEKFQYVDAAYELLAFDPTTPSKKRRRV